MKHRPTFTLPIKAAELPHLPACSDCHFAEMSEQNDKLFLCRKNPPAHMMQGGKGIWPMVREDDWCGEYKKAKDA